MADRLGEKYKWVILVSSALSFFGLIGLGNNVFSVYIISGAGWRTSFIVLGTISAVLVLIPVTVSLFMVPAYNTVAVPLLPRAAVKPELREKAVGWFSSAGYAGYAASQIISALVYDTTGSYVPIYVISGILMVPLTIIMIRSLKK